MAEKQVKPLGGVKGVLGHLLTPEAEPRPSSVPPQPSEPEKQEEFQEHPAETRPAEEPSRATASTAKESSPPQKVKARRGRPPAGTRTLVSEKPVEREKVSLRLRADLAATYRTWSWDERCQFSDLVDRAMEHYLKSHRKARKPEKE